MRNKFAKLTLSRVGQFITTHLSHWLQTMV